ncbi:MAG: hypothetical protein LQ347_005694 [Umbilicaria vellea]|nr:MAG: hypothetical protein LQ347_005694 [Umbilicaria vellea]
MALQVGQHSSPLPSSSDYAANTERLRHIADFFQSKYNFRTATRNSVKGLTTWLDQDRSGDYDPDLKTAQPEVASKRKREPPAGLRDESGQVKLKKPRTNTWQFGRRNGQSCPITLRFASATGRASLKKLCEAPDNGLSQPSQSETGDFCTSWWSANGNSFETDDTSHSSEPYSLRTQSRNRNGIGSHHFENRTSQLIVGLDEITLGHPAARGCKGCLGLGIHCTLLKEGYTYPCADCVEDDMECELVLPPLKKRPCENCRRRKIVCSYREGGNHSLPCQQCTDSTFKCNAGPLSGRTRTGPCLDQDLRRKQRFVPTSQRPFITCTQCRQGKRWCSLKSKDQEVPCKHCKLAGIGCTFEKLPDKPKKTRRRVSAKRAERLKQIEDPVVSNGVPTTKIIKTRYAHPITFNYLPCEKNEEKPSSCDWCASPGFGILGLEELEVEIIDPGAGQGYIEVSGGHTGRGRMPSRMCPDCTMERLQISGCKAHDIRLIEGLDPDDFDFDSAIERLIPGMQTEAGSIKYRYCSVCPGPAFLECCNPGTVGTRTDEEVMEPYARVGCGLLLCENCAVSLVEEHGGSLESLVAALEIDGGPFGLRADVKFLLESGELLQRITAGDQSSQTQHHGSLH